MNQFTLPLAIVGQSVFFGQLIKLPVLKNGESEFKTSYSPIKKTDLVPHPFCEGWVDYIFYFSETFSAVCDTVLLISEKRCICPTLDSASLSLDI